MKPNLIIHYTNNEQQCSANFCLNKEQITVLKESEYHGDHHPNLVLNRYANCTNSALHRQRINNIFNNRDNNDIRYDVVYDGVTIRGEKIYHRDIRHPQVLRAPEDNTISKFKFKVGEKVVFEQCLFNYDKWKDHSDLTVLQTGQSIINDEILVEVKNNITNQKSWYREYELLSEVEFLRTRYEDARKKYKEALLLITKAAIVRLTKQKETNSLNVEEFYSNGAYDRICKYCTPKDYPGNFCLSMFEIKDDKLIVTGIDIDDDDDSEYNFYEYDLEAEELAEINCLLENITNAIAAGEYTIDDDGNLNNTED